MNYFRKTKFRETSLIFVAIFIAIIYFTLSDSSEDSDVDVQALIDAAVEEAVEEALADNSNEYTDKSVQSTTTTLPPALAIPVDNYWGQYSDGTWAIVRLTEKPDNFEWAWDIFNMEDPSGAYGFDEFDENSTLIGTLVDFDCSFNRISKTKEHKEAFHKEEFGEFQTTIEYYDTYLDWAEDNYDYLTEEAALTISKIMRGVWTCDYEYLESISTEYLDFVHTGDAYAEVPKLSEYIASFEDNYDDDHPYGKYTYTLGALLYMTPVEESAPIIMIGCDGPFNINWYGTSWFQWPIESMNPKQLSEKEVAKMSMFDNGVTKSLIDGTYQGDDGTYGFRLQITTEGIWKSYKYTGHPTDSGLSKLLPDYACEGIRDPNTDTPSYKGTTPYITGINIVKGDSFDVFIIELRITQESGVVPNSPFIKRCNRETCLIDPEMGPFIPDDIEEWLYISFPGYSILRDSNGGWILDDEGNFVSTFYGSREMTSDGSILHARWYSEFEGNLELTLGIVPGSTFRSYQSPERIVIEVAK